MENEKYYVVVEIPEYNKKYVSVTLDGSGLMEFKRQLAQILEYCWVNLEISNSESLIITKQMLHKCVITYNKFNQEN